MRRLGCRIFAFSIVVAGCARPPVNAPPTEPPVSAALAYLQTHPVETFASRQPATQVRQAVAIDIDEDGATEVFVWVTPQYSQTPTVVVFSVAADGNVRRLAEGLAPGPLRRSADLLDSHVIGEGVDISDEGNRPAFPYAAAEAGLDEGLHIVAYRNFVHMDGRRGSGRFVDLTALPVDAPDCTGIGFSELKGISVGTFGGERVFLAATEDSIYAYRISRIDGRGLFTKQVRVLALPAAFVAFSESSSGQAVYRTRSGGIEALPVIERPTVDTDAGR